MQRIHTYIAEHNAPAAARVITTVERRANALDGHPEIGYSSDEAGVRIILAIPYPYRIYYRVTADKVEILHTRHTARKPPEPGQL